MIPRTTFYSEQAANRRYSLLLAFVVLLVLAGLGFAIGYGVSGNLDTAYVVVLGAVFLSLLLTAGSYYGGDSLVLSASHAREVTAQQAPQLFNVVQEMAVAANVPMPRVYIIDDTAPNAFATGRDPKHASIAITTGLLQKLDREELQGVIGHEMSHVRNYDIRFTLLVAVLVGSIALLADFFLRFTFFGGGPRRGGDREGGGGGGIQIVLFVVAIVLAILAPIFARMVLRGPVGHLEHLLVRRDLRERALEPGRVAGELHARRVGQVLALAADGELHQPSEDRRQDRQHDRHHEEHDLDAAPTTSLAIAAATRPSTEEGEPQEEVGEERDAADKDRHQQREPDVVVADVRHLVADHALQLLPVELLQQPGRDGDGRVLRVAPRREGIGRRVVDDIDARHRDVRRDGHLLHHVEELWRLLRGDFPCVRDAQNERIATEVRARGQQQGEEDRPEHHHVCGVEVPAHAVADREPQPGEHEQHHEREQD